jgi:hypothetical protein
VEKMARYWKVEALEVSARSFWTLIAKKKKLFLRYDGTRKLDKEVYLFEFGE